MKMTDIFTNIKGAAPKMVIPPMGKTVDIPVYLIHNSPNTEDYFFIYDFAQFVETSREGLFVRPRLKVWAGRYDFARAAFAQQFRTSFSEDFDAARGALTSGNAKPAGWFSWDVLGGLASFNWQGFVANAVLLVGTSASKMVWNALSLPRFLCSKSNATKLEDQISATQSKVDAALANMEITLHRKLWTHTYRGDTPGRMVGIDYDAWPLPAYVREHLNDGTSTAW